MRADIQVEALSSRFRIVLLIVQRYLRLRFPANQSTLNRCSSVLQFCGDQSDEEIAQLAVQSLPDKIDAVHVFRLNVVGVAFHLRNHLSNYPPIALDMDDLESKKAQRLASHFAAQGDCERAAAARIKAEEYADRERSVLQKIDQLYVSNPLDYDDLVANYGFRKTRVLPNAVRIPTCSEEKQAPTMTSSLLFVGALHYYPNEDGVVYFCEQIFERLRQRTGHPLTLQIVGTRPSRRVLALQKHPGVSISNDVASVEPYYHRAGVVIVPLRVAGGTRTKILEAFSYQVPVVSTSIGAEGLGISSGQELLIGDTPDEFASCCAQLMTRDDIASRLATRAYDWVRCNHTIANVKALIDEQYPREKPARRTEEVSALGCETSIKPEAHIVAARNG